MTRVISMFDNMQWTLIWTLLLSVHCSQCIESIAARADEPSTTANSTTPDPPQPRNASSRGRSKNDHDEIKSLINHVVDNVLRKIDVNQAIYVDEVSSMTDAIIGSFGRSMRELNARMQTLEVLMHQIDELTDYKNNLDSKLFRLNENAETNHAMMARLNELQRNVDYVRKQVDRLRLDQQTKRSNKIMPSMPPDTTDSTPVHSDGTDVANCEAKIDQVISFVHNFAEISRLESGDILNRLNNMQAQLIHFFDADKVAAKSHTHAHLRDKSIRNRTTYSEWTEHDWNVGENATATISASAIDSNSSNFSDNFSMNPNETDEPKHRRVARDALTSHRNAKYGLPTHVGCHRVENPMRVNGLHHFDTIESNRNAAGRDFNDRVCAYDADGDGWTVIQRRGTAQHLRQENFNRSWNEYKHGFGNLTDGDFWYGNDFIHQLTYDDDMQFRILLENWTNERLTIDYNVFRIDAERNNYNLMIDDFCGGNRTLDAMAYHNGQDFSTFDQQNDRTGIDGRRECCSCAVSYASGWWFNNCLEANLNGVYRAQARGNNFVGIIWEHWLGDYSLKFTQMMIRPKVEWNDDESKNEMNPHTRPPDDP